MTTKIKSETKPSKKQSEVKTKAIFDHLKKICLSRSEYFKKLGIWLIVACCAAALEMHQSGGSSLAMLYMIAENGKKSGRADGNVYMRNGRIRGMAIPSLVQNGYTQAVRAAFGNFSAGFRALSQAQQDAWNNAKGFFKSDRFARTFEVSGKALYQMLNLNLYSIGIAPILVPPAPDAVLGVTGLTVTIDDSANTFSLDFSPDPTDAGTIHLVEATGMLSAGVNRPGRSAFRIITTLAAGATSPADVNSYYVLKFGAPVAGTKIFVRLTPINNVTGQAGASIVAGTTVVA